MPGAPAIPFWGGNWWTGGGYRDQPIAPGTHSCMGLSLGPWAFGEG